jgi:hypothetical protein
MNNWKEHERKGRVFILSIIPAFFGGGGTEKNHEKPQSG